MRDRIAQTLNDVYHTLLNFVILILFLFLLIEEKGQTHTHIQHFFITVLITIIVYTLKKHSKSSATLLIY